VDEFPAATKMRELSNPPRRTKPRRWDVWYFFSEFLGIDVHGRGPVYRAYYKIGDDIPYWKEPCRDDDWMKSGNAYFSNDVLSLHRAAIVTDPLDIDGNTQSCVFAFMSHQNRIPELCVTVRRRESYIKCHCLWREFPIFRETLIKYDKNLNFQRQSKSIKKIRELLLIDNTHTWVERPYGYNQLREKAKEFGFAYADLVEVHHKASRQTIKGIIVGDPAIMGRESYEGLKPQILFLQIIEYDEIDEGEDSPFIPIEIHEDGEKIKQSIDPVAFRFAPYDVAHVCLNATLAEKDNVIKEIKRRLEELL